MSTILSKSTFIKGYQCPKALYLHKFHPELKDEVSDMQKAVFKRGNEIGELARQLFPGGINASPDLPNNYEKAIRYTAELVGEDFPVIYEAGFEYDGVTCFVDILKREENGWHAYEVKSSTNLSNIYHLDAALQYYVVKNNRLPVISFNIVLINSQYIRKGQLEISSLFTTHQVMNQVERLQSLIKKKTGELKEVLLSTSVPEVDIGPQCTDPYFCDFIGHCWKHIPEDSVFDVAGLVGNKKWGLYRNGVVRLVDIWDDFPLNIAQKLQIQSARTGKITWKKNEVDRFVKEFNYPLYFLDFESFQSPVPLYDNTRPYQQIPFQYSLHILDKKDGAVEHKEFLAKAGPDPRPDFVEYLLADLKDSGSIVVYNKSFEKRILLDIARDFPVYRKRLELIIPRMRDLMEPFRQKMIYMPQMRGSYSIKNVYPALVPGAGYQGLEIAEGSSASLAYEGLTKQPDEAIVERTRLNLLNYCRMDTLAMVEIWQAISV